MELTNIKRLEIKYKGLVEILDLRPLYCDNLKNYGKTWLNLKEFTHKFSLKFKSSNFHLNLKTQKPCCAFSM